MTYVLALGGVVAYFVIASALYGLWTREPQVGDEMFDEGAWFGAAFWPLVLFAMAVWFVLLRPAVALSKSISGRARNRGVNDKPPKLTERLLAWLNREEL